ncbi:hypothetical protein CMO94_04340 [Candidatus Woesearchaeota archaeon]|jgi:hypothetical protein|nr:hypothetical protein [Candidatus Woesearchaeota archaeon]
MAKKRGKKTSSKKSKAAKRTIKSSFKEKKVTYTDVKGSNIKTKDEELNKELKELETGKIYGYSGKKEVKPTENREVDKPKKKVRHSTSKMKNIFQRTAEDKNVPTWFYIASIFAAFLFTIYISIFATIHFEDIDNMNIMIVFLFIAMVSYFLISAMYFISEKKQWHAAAPSLFFIGIVAIMIYAFKAVDTSDLVRFSIIYTIIVTAVSAYVLAAKR